ncbi:hypothetical protein TMatcc_008434 [Talaromyces marneffei ATCC 18224]|uniref:Uncharacterized protein n=1 Tax=Talaromyces marneffei (strain ATCC 18224 / CBS 334.59 / QM 7333) TaxID=441960 RepID=B6QM10_TALMQ|nr:uncharacterized protein EYB26_007773 [Talaromyces marneffei]EEA22137.1 hypothetical protein PMAA_059170 [Talaromyces marneffei ATCC 18224]KAE8550407.1 hypothetical protein EYB25_006633 [Talaromyces marneffei]QGA20073.1 hypothetical protein EYB26_007773 [Talaromyces marneffei]
MEAIQVRSFISLPEGSKQQDSPKQEPSHFHRPSPKSSRTYTNAPTGTGHGASGQSVTTLTEHVEPNHYQAIFAHQQTLSADQQDLMHAGSWATIEPRTDPFGIENDPILSPIHRAGATTDSARQGTETTDCSGRENTEEAVGILRASLHHKV